MHLPKPPDTVRQRNPSLRKQAPPGFKRRSIFSRMEVNSGIWSRIYRPWTRSKQDLPKSVVRISPFTMMVLEETGGRNWISVSTATTVPVDPTFSDIQCMIEPGTRSNFQTVPADADPDILEPLSGLRIEGRFKEAQTIQFCLFFSCQKQSDDLSYSIFSRMEEKNPTPHALLSEMNPIGFVSRTGASIILRIASISWTMV